MIYLMDCTRVAADDAPRFLRAFEEIFLPPARRRGMELLFCWHTPDDLGEDVTVTSVFQLRDWAHWNELRRKMVLDPALADWLAELEALRRGGTRRFLLPAEFSPLGGARAAAAGEAP